MAAVPTNDGLTMLVARWPHAEFETNRRDVEGHFMAAVDVLPGFSARVRAA